jgi:tRNA(Ile)-lysidine synthase
VDPCIAAFSGGGDSTALLLALKAAGRPAIALHLDHAMDTGSTVRAARAVELAAALGVPSIVRAISVPGNRRRGESLEAAARRLRYDALERAADELGARWILTAHHRDDQAETVLLRLSFGTGLVGLAAIQERRGRILRPLLGRSRAELLDAVVSSGLEPVSDPSNRDLSRPRNRLRHLVLPRLVEREPRLPERLAAVAAAAWRARPRLPAPTAAAPRPPRNSAPPFSYTFQVPGSISLQPLSLRLRVEPAAWQDWMARGDARRAALAPLSAGGAVAEARSRRAGDVIRPLGAPGTRKLKDVLIDRKVPRAERDLLPLLALDGRIAWVPGVTIAEEFRCRPGEAVWLASLEDLE